MTRRRTIRAAVLLAFLVVLAFVSSNAFARTQEGAAATAQAEPAHASPGAELGKETREAAGEKEENADLKYSPSVRWLANKTGLTVHRMALLMFVVNFLIIVFFTYWFTRKSVPAMLRSRTESIQRALEEGRAASADANRRLSEIEARLSKLDSEVASMLAQSEKEAEAEEARIKQAAEDDIRKVVQAAEQEIALATKQARRELASHTADLAVALARKQIHVDSPTDRALVNNFAGKLNSGGGKDRQ